MDFGGVLLAICGLSLLCVGVLAVAGFLLGRSFLSPVVGSILSTIRSTDEIDAEDAAPVVRRGGRPRIDRPGRGRISAQGADPLDFDAAVARHRKDSAQRPSSQSPTELGTGHAPMERHGLGTADSDPEPLGGRSRGRRDERNLDELGDYFEGEDEEGDFF